MSNPSKERGFTIVETLIVLAVMGALFISATLLVTGRVSQVEFTQAMNDTQSVLQQTISQVGAGYYANTGNFTCNGTSGTLVINAGVNKQGSNTGCIFLGKAIQFGVKDTDPQQFRTYTIAGLQKGTDLPSSRPVAIAPGFTTNAVGGYPDVSVPNVLRSGLTVAWMRSGGVNIGAVAFVSGLGQYNGTELLSGAQQVSLVPVTGSALDSTTKIAVDAINNNLKTSPVSPSGGVQICFASGTTQKSGLITIGSNGRELSVTLQIKNGRNC
jgi:prepilin-type N-terminal cleavage/methylation domain-containing protein